MHKNTKKKFLKHPLRNLYSNRNFQFFFHIISGMLLEIKKRFELTISKHRGEISLCKHQHEHEKKAGLKSVVGKS